MGRAPKSARQTPLAKPRSQVVSKMKQSHLQMLDTMISRQLQDLTEEEVAPLFSLRDKAEAELPDWQADSQPTKHKLLPLVYEL